MPASSIRASGTLLGCASTTGVADASPASLPTPSPARSEDSVSELSELGKDSSESSAKASSSGCSPISGLVSTKGVQSSGTVSDSSFAASVDEAPAFAPAPETVVERLVEGSAVRPEGTVGVVGRVVVVGPTVVVVGATVVVVGATVVVVV